MPWSWIEQRPQIIANELNSHFEVVTVAPKSVLRSLFHQDKQLSGFSGVSRSYYVLPSCFNKGLVEKAMIMLNNKRCYGDIDRFGCVWLSHPSQIEHLPSTYGGTVVYDCMDDHISMASNANKEILSIQEKRLLDRADIVFVSSVYLKEKINCQKAVLVRNGYKQGSLFPVESAKLVSTHTIAYFGTVSQWFDFDAIDAVVRNFDHIRFRLIGPAEIEKRIERVEYAGPVKHSKLFDSVSDCSCLIMPFKVNEIIKAVDPVKLYEYIAFGKCVISVRYPEIERFSDYVYFYETQDELMNLVADLSRAGFPPKYTESSRLSFLEENTWEQRIATVTETLKSHGIKLKEG